MRLGLLFSLYSQASPGQSLLSAEGLFSKGGTG